MAGVERTLHRLTFLERARGPSSLPYPFPTVLAFLSSVPRYRREQFATTVHQTIVTNLEATRFTGAAINHFTAFQKKLVLYENQVNENNGEPGVKIIPTSYRASINDCYLRMCLTAHWIKAESLQDIIED